jgi:hypothetical protein
MVELGGAGAINFLKLIFYKIVTEKKIARSWKTARTGLLYDKGPQEETKNWRPISITNAIYRIFTCLMARLVQRANAATKYEIFLSDQKGFVHGLVACIERSLLVNEPFADARRKRKSIIATQIDFTNAFGNGPRHLFLSSLDDLGFPSEFVELVQDLYAEASSVISLPTADTEAKPWMSGVKQGCPLSPLLFNLWIEPILRRLQGFSQIGCKVESKYLANNVNINVLVYADDLILIAEDEEGMGRLLDELSDLFQHARVEVNPAKCVTVSSVWFPEAGGYRCSTPAAFAYRGQEIPKLGIQQ